MSRITPYNTTNNMRRGGHTISFGKPAIYKAPLMRNIGSSPFFMVRLKKWLLARKKAKAAKKARKEQRGK